MERFRKACRLRRRTSVTIPAVGFVLQVLGAVSEAGQFEVAIRLVQQMRAAGDVPSKVSGRWSIGSGPQ